jgi:hypothetical protein
MKSAHHQHILLLTATITPLAGINNLSYTDPAKRLQDYMTALEFYLAMLRPNERIVFCENSGSDLSALKALAQRMNAADRVEFLGFYGNDFPPNYGRGYGEFKLVDHAMSHSEMIRSAPQESVIIWKVTGRYIVHNLRQIIDTRPARSQLYCNYRDHPKRGWMDLYLLAWTPATYREHIEGVYPKLMDDPGGRPVTAEHLMREHLTETSFKGPFRFKRTPRLVGTRGADGAGYHLSGHGKYLLRSLMAKLAPWVWV